MVDWEGNVYKGVIRSSDGTLKAREIVKMDGSVYKSPEAEGLP
jgi:hypothetical protein